MPAVNNIHKDYREITVITTSGEEFKTRSTYRGKGDNKDILVLDIDKKTHPAWQKGGNRVNEKDDNIRKFKEKFGELDI